MYEMSPACVAHRGDALSGYTISVACLVSSDLVCSQPEKRCKRVGRATDSGLRQLPHGLGMVASPAPGDDSSGSDRLSGIVEVDETYWGTTQSGKRGRGATGKVIILVAVEHTGKKLGRIRLLRVPECTGDTLEAAMQETVTPGSIVETDGLPSYNGVAAKGYTHRVVRAEVIDDLLPHAHLVISLLKRWLLGTHQGGVQATHLDYYLDEFTFRFNRRNSHSRGMLFRRVLEYAVQVPPVHKADLRAKIE